MPLIMGFLATAFNQNGDQFDRYFSNYNKILFFFYIENKKRKETKKKRVATTWT